jgi:hypothetical protein
LAVIASERAETNVYVQPLGRPGGQVRISSDGGSHPVWSRDGRWLYFSSGRRLMQSAVRTGEAFGYDPPAPVFTLERAIVDYDVSPDGLRFLVVQDAPSNFLPWRVLVNWRAAMR